MNIILLNMWWFTRNVVDTIRSYELAYGYKFSEKQIEEIVKNYYRQKKHS